MSKSKNNGVDPQALIDQYGADTARLFMMFAAPPEQSLEWSDAGVEGAFRFLKRLWKAVYEHVAERRGRRLHGRRVDREQPRPCAASCTRPSRKSATTIGRRQQFNTAIAAVMELMNALAKAGRRQTPSAARVRQEALEAAVLLLAPIVPHICQAL